MKTIAGFLLGGLVVLPLTIFSPSTFIDLLARAKPRVVFQVAAPERVVALTIDDGPSPATDEILAVLAEHGSRATFFAIGEHVLERPATTRRIVAEGHELAHHMMRDEPSIRLPRDAFIAQFERVDSLLAKFDGVRLFRPGSGWFDDAMIAEVERRGYRLALGSVYPFDATVASVGFSSWYILRNVRPGGIIILHDGPDRGVRTAEVLRRVLPLLREKGYRIVRLSEIMPASAARPLS